MRAASLRETFVFLLRSSRREVMSETETVLPPASLGATSASMRFVAVDQSTCPEGAPAGVGGSDPSASLVARAALSRPAPGVNASAAASPAASPKSPSS